MARLILAVLLAVSAATGVSAQKTIRVGERSNLSNALTAYPQVISPSCNMGRARLYDECGSQVALFEAAQAQARQSGKVLLVSFGAEWCVWCHVFDRFLAGEHTEVSVRHAEPEDRAYTDTRLNERPTSDPRGEAEALRDFAAQEFVLVHIDFNRAPGGYEVLERTGAAARYPNELPFIFTVDGQGHFAAALEADGLQTRRDSEDWWRGYRRGPLLDALRGMADAARGRS